MKVQLQVFTAKCSERQASINDSTDEYLNLIMKFMNSNTRFCNKDRRLYQGRNMKLKKKMKLFWVCVVAFTMALLMSMTVQAGTPKSNALKAYKKLLSQKTVKWGDSSRLKVPLKDCQFAIAYIDNDTVPELFIYNNTVTSHADGLALMYTYKNGKLRFVGNQFMDMGVFSYYKKKGIYTDNHFQMGVVVNTYKKLSNYRGVVKLRTYKEVADVDRDGKLTTTYCVVGNGNSKEVSKSKFDNELKKLVGSQKKTSLVWRKNTKANRTKFLK